MQRGFTIVELLIVIVVIGILAAISLVTYNGIQDKARNAKRAAALDVYEKTLRSYEALNGTMPAITESADGAVCAGEAAQYPAKDGFLAGECAYNLDNGIRSSVLAAPSLVSAIRGITTGSVPDGSFPPYSFKTTPTATIHIRGMFLTVGTSSNQKVDGIGYYAKPDGQPCEGRTEGYEASMDGTGNPGTMTKICTLSF